MANNKSAAKRSRQTLVNTARNASVVTSLKTQQKKFRSAVQEGKKETIYSAFVALSSSLDKAAKKGVLHKNSVNRRKSALAKSLVA